MCLLIKELISFPALGLHAEKRKSYKVGVTSQMSWGFLTLIPLWKLISTTKKPKNKNPQPDKQNKKQTKNDHL